MQRNAEHLVDLSSNLFTISVTGTSSSQKQQSVKIVNRCNLPQFLSDSKPIESVNQKPESNSQVLTLKEEPLVFIPDKLQTKLNNNTELFEKIFGSFENFLLSNPPVENNINQAISETELQKPQNNELQKQFEPVNKTNVGFQKSLNQTLKCYINACISENLNERAYAMLMSIRRTNPFRKYKVEFNDPELYSDLMTKYASLQNWSRVNEIYEILIAEKIPVTPHIYMSILDCLGRMDETTNNIRLITEFINKANEQVGDFLYIRRLIFQCHFNAIFHLFAELFA